MLTIVKAAQRQTRQNSRDGSQRSAQNEHMLKHLMRMRKNDGSVEGVKAQFAHPVEKSTLLFASSLSDVVSTCPRIRVSDNTRFTL